MKCKKCGEKLSKKEEKEYRDSEGGEVICTECFLMMEESHEEPDEYSDADPGL